MLYGKSSFQDWPCDAGRSESNAIVNTRLGCPQKPAAKPKKEPKPLTQRVDERLTRTAVAKRVTAEELESSKAASLWRNDSSWVSDHVPYVIAARPLK
jgi:hypothetical protein